MGARGGWGLQGEVGNLVGVRGGWGLQGEVGNLVGAKGTVGAARRGW